MVYIYIYMRKFCTELYRVLWFYTEPQFGQKANQEPKVLYFDHF